MRLPRFISQHLIATTLGVVVLVGGTGWYVIKSRPPEIKYTTTKVRRGSITSVVQATGTINALTTVPVGSFISGTVQFIFADFNTRVHAGQVLAQLDPAFYEAAYVTAKGNLDNARGNEKNVEANIHSVEATIAVNQANVAKLQADVNYVRANALRVHSLTTQGIYTKDQSDLADSTLAQAEASVVAAQAQVMQARAQLEQVKAQLTQAHAQASAAQGSLDQAITNLNYSTIVSPIDGTVIVRNITVGQSVAASLTAPNVFTIAQDLKRMQLYAATDESDTGNIHVGADVTFQVDAFPGDQFHGRVSTVRLNATTVQNVVTYSTIIDFDNPEEKLLPGETAYVTIPTGQAENVVEIPNAALSYVPDMPFADLRALYVANKIPRAAYSTHLGGAQVVWVKDAEGKPKPLAIKTGITDYVNTQMIDGPLKEGDELITFQEGGAKAATGGSNPLNQTGGRGGGPGGGGGGGGRGGGR